ncbi:MAG: DUF1566 domain-containing protein [Crocinitomicaceae bacterium]|jgi:hypothetical protein|tara:strand:- start:2788 stop:3183 length:396 start_codon:yes stop_codon:yes gene_type:complete
MKVLFVFVLAGFLISCGNSEKESTMTDIENKIIIGSLEVMKEDLGVMEWEQAEQACENLGNGWRLPSLKELEIVYKNRIQIGGFEEDHYWSSSEPLDVSISNAMMIIRFGIGDQFYNGKQTPNHVRAVRDL